MYIRNMVVRGAAYGMWVPTWANAVDEAFDKALAAGYDGIRRPYPAGAELYDWAPPPPPEAFRYAREFVYRVEAKSKHSIADLYDNAVVDQADAEEFGRHLVMYALEYGLHGPDDALSYRFTFEECVPSIQAYAWPETEYDPKTDWEGPYGFEVSFGMPAQLPYALWLDWETDPDNSLVLRRQRELEYLDERCIRWAKGIPAAKALVSKHGAPVTMFLGDVLTRRRSIAAFIGWAATQYPATPPVYTYWLTEQPPQTDAEYAALCRWRQYSQKPVEFPHRSRRDSTPKTVVAQSKPHEVVVRLNTRTGMATFLDPMTMEPKRDMSGKAVEVPASQVHDIALVNAWVIVGDPTPPNK